MSKYSFYYQSEDNFCDVGSVGRVPSNLKDYFKPWFKAEAGIRWLGGWVGCFVLDQVSVNTLYWLAAVKDKTIGQNSSGIPVIHAFLSGTTRVFTCPLYSWLIYSMQQKGQLLWLHLLTWWCRLVGLHVLQK